MPSPRHIRHSIPRKPVPSLIVDEEEQQQHPIASSSKPKRPSLTLQPVVLPKRASDIPHPHSARRPRFDRVPTPIREEDGEQQPYRRPRCVSDATPSSRPGTPPPPRGLSRRRASSPPPPVPPLPLTVARRETTAAKRRPGDLHISTADAATGRAHHIGRITSVLRPGESEGAEPYWEFAVADEDEDEDDRLSSPPESPVPRTPTRASATGLAITSPRPRGGYYWSPTRVTDPNYAVVVVGKYGAT
jgi:hypothetical protein